MYLTYRAVLNKGFTLLELLVVLAMLTAMAGIGVSVVAGVEDNANDDFVQTEMRSLVVAVKRFQADTGLWPGQANYSRNNPFDWIEMNIQSGANDWDRVSARGWRGPYISEPLQSDIEVTAGKEISLTGADSGNNDDLTTADGVAGLQDPWNTPYALIVFGTNQYNGALVSAGENAVFDTLPTTSEHTLCGALNTTDDWVLCF